MDIKADPITSHEIWRFIPHRGELSHKAKLIEIYETEVWDKSHKVFYSIERHFQLN